MGVVQGRGAAKKLELLEFPPGLELRDSHRNNKSVHEKGNVRTINSPSSANFLSHAEKVEFHQKGPHEIYSGVDAFAFFVSSL